MLTAVWLTLPAVLAYRTGELDPRWFVATLAPTFLVVALGSRRGLGIVAGKTVFAAVLGSISLLYAVSIDVQGEGFNEQFFFHLDWNTLSFVFEGFPGAAYPLLGLLVCQILTTAVVRVRGGVRRGVFAAVAVVLVSVSPPVTSLVGHVVDSTWNEVDSELASIIRERRTQTPRLRAAGRPKNIVLVYMESFESLYLDSELLGYDLAPELRELMASGQNFVDMRQMPGTGWTTAGIFASQCGLSLKSSVNGNHILARIDPISTGGCFAQLLGDFGYHTVFMGGASGEFGGKEAFLRENGYDEVLGRDEFRDRVDLTYRNPWGLHDDTLFDLAREQLGVLRASNEPFLLTLLTLGTHAPRGFVPPTCDVPEELLGSIRAGIYCSAKLITEFVHDVLESDPQDDTLVVLLSDHLTLHVDVMPLLLANSGRRRLSFALLAPWIEPQQIDRPGTHFDIAPTVLEAAGLVDFGDFPLGHSLLSNDRAFVLDQGISPEQLDDFDILSLWGTEPVIPGTIVLDGPNERIQLAGRWIRMMKRKTASDNFFLAIIDADGRLAWFGTMDPLRWREWVEDNFVVVFARDPTRLAQEQLASLGGEDPTGPIFLVGRAGGPMRCIDATKLTELSFDGLDQ